MTASSRKKQAVPDKMLVSSRKKTQALPDEGFGFFFSYIWIIFQIFSLSVIIKKLLLVR